MRCRACEAHGGPCAACVASLTARAEADRERDREAMARVLVDVAAALSAEAREDVAELRRRVKALELDLLLLALRHDVAISPLSSPALEKVRQLWERSASYGMTRRARWELLTEVYPLALGLAPWQIKAVAA